MTANVQLGMVKYRVDIQRDANSYDMQLVFQPLLSTGGVDMPAGKVIVGVPTMCLDPDKPQPLQTTQVVELPVFLKVM